MRLQSSEGMRIPLVPPADELTKASAELDQDARLNVYRQQGG
jgi:hypothetical protein